MYEDAFATGGEGGGACLDRVLMPAIRATKRGVCWGRPAATAAKVSLGGGVF